MPKKEVNENGLTADLFTDDSPQPRKAILMLGGSEGGKSWSRIKRPIEFLVQQGSVVSYGRASQRNDLNLEKVPGHHGLIMGKACHFYLTRLPLRKGIYCCCDSVECIKKLFRIRYE
jgi:hypothetical protein